jgi:hypothetical protein
MRACSFNSCTQLVCGETLACMFGSCASSRARRRLRRSKAPMDTMPAMTMRHTASAKPPSAIWPMTVSR